MVTGQELVKKVQDEYNNSGGALSFNFEEFCEFFKLEAPVAEHLIEELCATGWFQFTKTVDSSSGEESNRLQIRSKYRRNFWLYSELVPKEAKVILELGALLKNPLNSRIKNLEIEDQHIVKLILQDQDLHTIPSSIGNLTHLKILKIQRCKLTSLPETIGNLKSLKELDLDFNNLTVLPETIGKLENLQELWCRHNKLTGLPKALGSLKNLRILSLDNNQLTTLPENIGLLKKIQRLTVKGNKLTELPESLGDLTSLKIEKLKEPKHSKSDYLLLFSIIGNCDKLTPKFIRYYAGGTYAQDYLPTIGHDITTKKITVKDTVTKLILLNLASGKFFNKLRPSLYRGNSACIIVFDKSDRQSFDAVSDWLEDFRKHVDSWIVDSIIPVVLLGINTKEEDVSTDEGKALAELLDLPYFETTAPKFEKANEIFEYLTRKAINL